MTNFDDLLRLWLNLHVHLRHLYAMWRFVTYFMETFLEMCLSIAHRVTVLVIISARSPGERRQQGKGLAPSLHLMGFLIHIHGTKMLTGEE